MKNRHKLTYSTSTQGKSLSSLSLLHHRNEEFKTKLKCNVLFKLIEAGEISAKKNRESFLSYLQVWANCFQKAMLLKTALCDDPNFMPLVRQHFDEEYGHDQLLAKDRQTEVNKKDPILEAICNWFPWKMLSFNQYEQVVLMNLCLEGAATVFYNNAQSIIDPHKKLNYFKAHEEVDQDHEKMGSDLLADLSEKQYARLLAIQEEAWSMMEALLKRLGELVIQVKHAKR